jgi:AraC-like DNA-binding protein
MFLPVRALRGAFGSDRIGTNTVSASARDQTTTRQFLDALKKAVPAAQGLVITTLPRSDLQIAQPSNLSDALLRAYSRGYHAEDNLSWQTLVKRRPLRPQDAWKPLDSFHQTPYYKEFMEPAKLAYVISVPLGAPVLEGYPGVVHMLRTEEQGDFTSAEVEKLSEMARQFDAKVDAARAARRNACCKDGPIMERPPVRFSVVDSHFKPKVVAGTAGPANWSALDTRLRDQMVEAAKRRHHQLNGHPLWTDRLLLPDSDGDSWTFRIVTRKTYPALGEGAFTFFCLQPDCHEWGVVKGTDFQADAELARLIPALKFMQQEFSNGPTLVDIAKTVELSPFHFHRRFTELLGLTPKQFLLECQINQAKTELLAREKELVQIAKECGFAHQSHFTSRFKQATGLTPTRWRRMATERQKAMSN